ncbi:YjgP/YjgQ family permease [Chlorobium sp. BLA1]|uniref:LptF/LptG family permease n=1 Tax=Candidatus Chlorobium masyuteum TaxID=2716876 RepID=UPI00142490C1|nr:LptF/LptG family permease [Candidatus Chlorobium masyuteum]NHQ61096.1 YjgP/YjgQ family permease [Candidatus Chlorobium masyuteum]
MKIIDRYILKSHVGPFLFAFITILFVLILQFFASFADRFIGRGIAFSAILELIILQSAWMVGLAAPMAVLIAVVMAFGSLTTNSEMTVLRASGISLYRLMFPVLCTALLLSLGVERFNNIVLPQANYYAKSLMVDIARAKPAFGLKENAFSTLVDGYSILVREADDQSKEIRGVVIYDRSRPNFTTMVTAERGTIEFSGDFQYLVMTLLDGEIHQVKQPAHQVYRNLSFKKYRFVFESSGFGFARTSANRMRTGDSELSARELLSIGDEFQKRIAASEKRINLSLESMNRQIAGKGSGGSADESRKKEISAEGSVDRQLAALDAERQSISANRSMYNRYMAAYHKKYSLSLACFVFVLVGAPLGVLARRGGFGVGAGMSLLFFVLYWMLMISGETIAERGLLDPMLSMWLGNIVISAIGILLAFSLNRSIFNTTR